MNTIVTQEGDAVFEPEDRYSELMIGAGTERRKMLTLDGKRDWKNLITLDMSERVNPDILHDLNDLPLPIADESFDEVHAYHVLEHLGVQGDFRTFFAQFTEFHRILKPGGIFYAAVPSWDSVHAFGDPGHTRIINETTITFLQQDRYGQPPMTDYRDFYKVDFECLAAEHKDETFIFALRKK